MVGGIILARSLNEAEGTDLLNDCRRFLRDALANRSGTSGLRIP
jgi:hypothetical protein